MSPLRREDHLSRQVVPGNEEAAESQGSETVFRVVLQKKHEIQTPRKPVSRFKRSFMTLSNIVLYQRVIGFRGQPYSTWRQVPERVKECCRRFAVKGGGTAPLPSETSSARAGPASRLIRVAARMPRHFSLSRCAITAAA